MFSPATRKVHRKSATRKVQDQQEKEASTPPPPCLPFSSSKSITRPATGTPAPWSIPSSLIKQEKAHAVDQTRPVFVADFPQLVRNAQANLLQKHFSNAQANQVAAAAGGIDKGTSLAWMICGAQLYIWSYASSSSLSKNCVLLQLPSPLFTKIDQPNHWAVCIVASSSSSLLVRRERAQQGVGIIVCNQRTQGLAYWPDIYSKQGNDPIIDFLPESDEECCNFNSIIAAPVPGSSNECIAITCQPNATLWLFEISANAIHRRKISAQVSVVETRSLVWQPSDSSDMSFLLLTNEEVQCWTISPPGGAGSLSVEKVWGQVVVGNDGDSGIKKDWAGQKHVWLLDLQVDERGRDVSILVATFCKDRGSSSNYTQYSLLTMQCNNNKEKVLEKKAPPQVIIPKGRVEDEETLLSMRLRVGGKPCGSITILSADGTATVANQWRGSMRLYQFDLPWDADKVLDVSVLPTADEEEIESEGGAWVVLTENAGVWAIPEKAVLMGGVEPPERSLSRKGSTNEGTSRSGGGGEDNKRFVRRSSSEVFNTTSSPERKSSRQSLSGFAQTQRGEGGGGGGGGGGSDEEAEALLFRAFHDFVLSGGIEGGDDLADKLAAKGAFEREGETNVFSRTSRSIVDTLAKHWTTNRGPDFVASAIVSSLLFDKHQKHQKFLQLLALSNCHQQLSSKQRYSMLNIMEHGEKLSSLIQLRELQSMIINQQQQQHEEEERITAGPLWKLIELVGEKAQRNNVILMDRDSAEVFYSKISDLEEFFSCLSHYLHHIITPDSDDATQIRHAFELSNACTTLIQSATHYKQEHINWYPSLEGLTPWTSQPVVRSGLWAIASFLIELSKEASGVEMALQEQMLAQLQALTDALLQGYNGSIVAKEERGEETKGLSQEYHARADQLLGCLYQFAKVVAQTKYQELSKGVEDVELKRSIMKDIYSAIMLIAMQHGGHQTLWDICYDLSDASLLRILMHDCVGFSTFAFKQLLKRGEHSKLLRLGEEFGEELGQFLRDRIHLLWLHDIFMKQFSAASDNLHALALSSSSSSLLLPPSLLERRRFLYLSKIAALAGKDEGFDLKIGRIEADLRILKLQEEIVEGDGGKKRELIGPVELIRMCLNKGGRDLALKAFEVFAWTSPSFRASNRSLLEECWSNAADQDDWPAIQQLSVSQGWTDDLILQSLRQTLVCNASSRCYAPDAQVFQGGFEEVLPLMGTPYSVEQVLMQHRYFPDAGKLMLTALALGKDQPTPPT